MLKIHRLFIYKIYFNFRIIIIENCSMYSDYKWLNVYNNLKFKKLDENYRFEKDVNEEIKISNLEYILLLNNGIVAK